MTYAPVLPMIDRKRAVLGAAAFLRDHPVELLRALRAAPKLRFGLPIAALRWLAAEIESPKGPRDVVIDAQAPGIRIAATVEQMATQMRVQAHLTVTQVRLSDVELTVEVRLADVKIKLLDEGTQTPLAALIRSGALDLTRAANLVAHMPAKPPVLVQAVEDRLVLDFMRIPRLAKNHRLRRLIGTVSRLLNVRGIETEGEHLDVLLQLLPGGMSALNRR